MRGTCYCGRVGEIEDREPIVDVGGERALRYPYCGLTDRLLWLPEDERLSLFKEAERRSARGGSSTIA